MSIQEILGKSWITFLYVALAYLIIYFSSWMTYGDHRCVTTSNEMYEVLQRYDMDVYSLEGLDVDYYQELYRDLYTCQQKGNTEIYKTPLFRFYDRTKSDIPFL